MALRELRANRLPSSEVPRLRRCVAAILQPLVDPKPFFSPPLDEIMFFDSWMRLGRILIVGALAYGALILLLRVSGKRTLSKMNAFDFIITVAMGSTLATILLSPDVTLSEGILALALLIALQFIITWASVRSSRVKKLVTSEPALLLFRGEFLDKAMRRERITEGEVRASVREAGGERLDSVQAVVLETDGSLSILIRKDPAGGGVDAGTIPEDSALVDVMGLPHPRDRST